ncbi:hypothetical protein [Streptomyces sp. NRRL F-5727]|uniref:hypothetical protein n=1 Tax=Streptomyces sp. NRRL F-5727 TaxID=1463871 RepID=UPI0004C96791|nr:hypothetical protein [Streptomyces sp. NRRL F-5727]
MTFQRRLGHPDLGRRKRLTGRYCTVGDAGHTPNAATSAEPASRPGRHRQATGSGAMVLQDRIGNSPGGTGAWQASGTGALVC